MFPKNLAINKETRQCCVGKRGVPGFGIREYVPGEYVKHLYDHVHDFDRYRYELGFLFKDVEQHGALLKRGHRVPRPADGQDLVLQLGRPDALRHVLRQVALGNRLARRELVR
jgi:hypothetical protein|tara:strand:- start:68 stop:406 length:339 start_codon:yes stop_codon:yes gene_type:complete